MTSSLTHPDFLAELTDGCITVLDRVDGDAVPVEHDRIDQEPLLAGRVWAKVRHADTADATVVGFTGAARHPKALAVRLPDGRVALSQRLTTALASVVGPRLVPQARRAFTKAGDPYTPASGDAVVEVVAGTTRHAVVTVVRLR
ncbi:hypothetical protein ACFYO0_46285 [Streptomyces sp. NPDC006365]|uniref:hypothetical protein n=1 Tax=Streptomyces sp. NPDC006365 TaxID=3364744 RepID=UPI0036C12575